MGVISVADIPKPELPEALRNGVYANYFSISVSEDDGVIDFAHITPQPRGVETTEPELYNQVVGRSISRYYYPEFCVRLNR